MSPRASVEPDRVAILRLIERLPGQRVRALYVAKYLNRTVGSTRRLLADLVERGDLELTSSIEGGTYEWRLANNGEEPTG